MDIPQGSSRAGQVLQQSTGYRAFIPSPLPPDPPLRLDDALLTKLSDADRALARLDAATEFLPNPDLFVAMYVRKEAVLSSQIEGTQASMVDLLDHEVRAARTGRASDVQEVVNYVRAMNKGLERLSSLPLSLRLLREIHAELLSGVRGSERNPGEFRKSQNWIGPAGCGLADATFVPPPPHELLRCLGELETFLHDESAMPVLVRIALVHAQFETIHPFLDGNGRVGRLLITFFLCWKGVLQRPMLYLSHFFKRRREDYYARLQAVRDRGDFESWVGFFLDGVKDVSREGTETARQIQRLREEHRGLLQRELPGSSVGPVLLDHLYQHPVVTVNQVKQVVERSYPAANQLVSELEKLGLLREVTGGARNRVYRYDPYLSLFED